MRRTKLNKRGKSERQKLILENDKIFRQLILARDKVCQKTGSDKNLQVAHYHTRSNLRVRWTEENAVLLCGGSHFYFAHKYPDKFREWFINHLGISRFTNLELKARYVSPVKMDDLLATNYYLKKRLAQLTKEGL